MRKKKIIDVGRGKERKMDHKEGQCVIKKERKNKWGKEREINYKEGQCIRKKRKKANDIKRKKRGRTING